MRHNRPCIGCGGRKEVQNMKTPRSKFKHIIKENKAMCKNCGDVVESKHRHDFVTCSCGWLSVDGGHDYTRRVFKEDGCFVEMSVIVKEKISHENTDNS